MRHKITTVPFWSYHRNVAILLKMSLLKKGKFMIVMSFHLPTSEIGPL